MTIRHVQWAVVLAAVAGAVALLVLQPTGMEPRAIRVAAVCLVAIAFFATGLLSEQVTALGFFTVAMLFSVAPPGIVFSAFSSSALWLVVGGLFIGQGVRETGLGARLARAMLRRFGGSYFNVVAGLGLGAFLLMIVMPSVMGRVLILVPLVLAFADRLGFGIGSRGCNGMVLTVALASFITAGAVLPSSVGNVIVAGAGESLFGISFTYGSYMLAQMPTNGLLKLVVIVLVCWLAFRVPVPKRTTDADEAPTPWTAAERRMAAILVLSLAAWATDFLHGIDPGWVGLAAGFVCLLPRVGVLPAADFEKHLRFGPALYAAGMMGFGAVLAWSGVGAYISGGLVSAFGFTGEGRLTDFLLLHAISAGFGPVTSQVGVAAILPPLAEDLAAATGLPLYAVLLTIISGYATLIMPYQAVPMVIALRLAGVPFGSAALLTLVTAAATLLLLAPLTYSWWRLIGVVN